MSLLDETPRPPAERRPLRYQKVIDLVDEIIRTQDLQPGSLLPTQKQLAGARRSEPDHGPARARGARAGGPRGRPSGRRHLRRAAADRVRAGPPRRLARHARRPRRPRRGDDGSAQGTRRRARRRPSLARSGSRPARACGSSRGCGASTAGPWCSSRRAYRRRCAPDLGRRRDDLAQSLYGLLARRYGLVDDYEEQYLEVDVAGAAERRRLELAARARIVRLQGVSFAAGDVPFDCFEHVYPAEAFAFFISGRTSRRLLPAEDLAGWRSSGSRRSG